MFGWWTDAIQGKQTTGCQLISTQCIFPRPHSPTESGIPMQSPPQQPAVIQKQEDDDKGEKRDIKPVPKTLNGVPRMSKSYLLI